MTDKKEKVTELLGKVRRDLPKTDLPLESREMPNLHAAVPQTSGVSQKTMESIAALESSTGTPDKEPEVKKEDELSIPEVLLGEEGEWHDMREALEKKLEPMRFEDLITGPREIRQLVPIRKGFEVIFRTVSVNEDLHVKKELAAMGKSSARVYFDSYVLLTLVCSVESINGEPLPSYMEDKKVDPVKFKERSDKIWSYPMQLVEMLSHNYVWFDTRVRKLISEPEVKNG